MLHKRDPSGGRTSSHDVTAPRSSAGEEAPIAGPDTGYIAQTKQLFDGYEMTSGFAWNAIFQYPTCFALKTNPLSDGCQVCSSVKVAGDIAVSNQICEKCDGFIIYYF